jgi:hypothetical protein
VVEVLEVEVVEVVKDGETEKGWWRWVQVGGGCGG